MRRCILAIAAIIAAGPAAAQSEAGEPDFTVATTFTIVADMAREVAGPHADVVSITRPGAEVHGYRPTPRDILAARDADLILWNGLNLELWFEQFFARMDDIPAVTVSDGIDPIAVSGGDYDGRPNPHGWMGLEPALLYVDNIADALATHDPEHADDYRANAEAYKAEITATIAPLRDAVRALPEEDRWLVTSEGAFSYLARDFGLRELFLWPMNSDAQGTPQQVRAVIDAVRENDIPVVFSESTVSPDPAQQVARETGARYGGVLYVDSLSEADGPVPTYLDLLRVTSQTIHDALTAPDA